MKSIIALGRWEWNRFPLFAQRISWYGGEPKAGHASSLLLSWPWTTRDEVPTVLTQNWPEPDELQEPTVVSTFVWRKCIKPLRKISATLKESCLVKSYLTLCRHANLHFVSRLCWKDSRFVKQIYCQMDRDLWTSFSKASWISISKAALVWAARQQETYFYYIELAAVIVFVKEKDF